MAASAEWRHFLNYDQSALANNVIESWSQFVLIQVINELLYMKENFSSCTVLVPRHNQTWLLKLGIIHLYTQNVIIMSIPFLSEVW